MEKIGFPDCSPRGSARLNIEASRGFLYRLAKSRIAKFLCSQRLCNIIEQFSQIGAKENSLEPSGFKRVSLGGEVVTKIE